MLSINYPKIENKSYPNLELSLIEPMHKLNLRGKNREFFSGSSLLFYTKYQKFIEYADFMQKFH